MRLVINYFDTVIDIDNDRVFALEIENKGYFWRVVSNLISLQNNEMIDEIMAFESNQEINICGNITVILDYFNLDEIFKRYHTALFKYIINSLDNDIKEEMILQYSKLQQEVLSYVNSLEIPCTTNVEFNFENIIKSFKLNIELKDDLLSNLLLILI